MNVDKSFEDDYTIVHLEELGHNFNHQGICSNCGNEEKYWSLDTFWRVLLDQVEDFKRKNCCESIMLNNII